MSEDRLLRDLAEVVGRQPSKVLDDPRWQRLSAGLLSAAEEAELKAMAEGSEEARAAYEAFRPLDETFRAGVVEALRARTGGSSSTRNRSEVPEGTQRQPQPAGQPQAPEQRSRGQTSREQTVATVRHFPGPTKPYVGRMVAALAALAAGLLLVVRAFGPGGPSLPEYHVTREGGNLATRSSTVDRPGRFEMGSRLVLTLTPAEPVTESIAARLFLEQGGERRQWATPKTFLSGGGLRVEGVLGRELEIEPGDWTILVVIGTGRLPEAKDLRNPAKTHGKDWVVERIPIRIESAP